MPGVSGISGLAVQPFGGGVSSPWLLADTFTPDLAVGNVDGTPAVPGPGTRKVDADNVWLSGGKCYFSGAGGRLRYAEQITREAGRVAIFKGVTLATLNQWIAWATAAPWTGTAATAAAYATTKAGTSDLSRFTTLSNILYDGPHWPEGTPIDAAIVLRATGASLMIRESTYFGGKWAWIRPSRPGTGTNSPLYVAVKGGASSSSNLEAIGVPIELVSGLLSLGDDTFNRSNGAIGSTDGNELEESGGSGKTWQDPKSDWFIVGGARAECSGYDGTMPSVCCTLGTSTPNIHASTSITITIAGAKAGFTLRLDNPSSPQSAMVIYVDSNTPTVYAVPVLGGSYQAMVSLTNYSGQSLPFRLDAWAYGTRYWYALNGIGMSAPFTYSNANINNNTYHGLHSGGWGGIEFDSFYLHSMDVPAAVDELLDLVDLL